MGRNTKAITGELCNQLLLCITGLLTYLYTEYNQTYTFSPHFKISDTEKIFGQKNSEYINQTVIVSVKDVIYQKRKKGDKMNLADVKRAMLKNLHIMRTQESTSIQISNFDNNCRIFIDCLKTDLSTQHSWYKI